MTIIDILILILILAVLILCAYVLHKVRRVHLMQYALQQQVECFPNSVRQVQAFIDLNRLLQLSWSLPPLGGWAASPDFLLLLAEYMLQYQPEVIVECSSGASTVVLAQCAKLNGKGQVLSLEHDAHYAEKTRQELTKQGLQNWAIVIDAPLQDYSFDGQNYLWYTLDMQIQGKQIDMLIIDGPPASLNHCARYPAGPLLLPLLNKDAVVFLDDANRYDEQQIIKNWLNEFPNLQVNQHNCEKGAVNLCNVVK